MSEQASISQNDDGSFVIQGELSFSSVAPLLNDADILFDGDNEHITVDLRGVERADSAGLSLLIQWWRLARQANKDIRYTNLPKQMMAIAKLGGLSELLPVQS